MNLKAFITSFCRIVHPDLMGSGRTEPQLKPLIVPRPPAHHCGKWRSMSGKMISFSLGFFFYFFYLLFFSGPCKIASDHRGMSSSRENSKEMKDFYGERQYGDCMAFTAVAYRLFIHNGCNCAEKSHIVLTIYRQ